MDGSANVKSTLEEIAAEEGCFMVYVKGGGWFRSGWFALSREEAEGFWGLIMAGAQPPSRTEVCARVSPAETVL